MHTDGLTYKKLDLHVHTPASRCFLKEHDSEAEAAKAIVAKAIEEGLSAIAITDHNTGAFVPHVQQAATGKGLVVFPGVEITVGDAKNHVIALLDPSKGIEDLNDLLAEVGVPNADRGKKEAFSPRSVAQVVETVAQPPYNGIPVLAHIDSSNGVFDTMRGEPRTQLMQNARLFAVEATNYGEVRGLLDGTHPNYKVKLAVYQASDSPLLDENGERVTDGENAGMHSTGGIGYRYTYFKVDELITLESLKQCFYDPDVRIKVPSAFETTTCPSIDRVKINSGFLTGVDLRFHKGLNSILGAKGVGKSLLVEFIRFALGQEPVNEDVLQDHHLKLEEQLGQYGQVEVGITDETGKEYTIKRTYGAGTGQAIECVDDSTGQVVDVNVSQLFRILALSQNEIIRIAEDRGNETLQFIDGFFDFNAYRTRIEILENELSALDRSFATAIRAYYETQKLEKSLKTAKVELGRIEKQLKSEVFKEIGFLEKQDKCFRDQTAYLRILQSRVSTTKAELEELEEPQIDKDFEEFPPLLRNRDTLKKSQKRVVDALEAQLNAITKDIEAFEAEHNAWLPTYHAKQKELEEYVRKVGGDVQGLETQRKRKADEITAMETRLETVTRSSKELSSIAAQRKAKLDELNKVYENYFNERKSKCDYLVAASNGKLEIDIEGASNREVFRTRMMEIKTGSYLRDYEIEKLCNKISPVDFVYELLRYEIKRDTDSTVAAEKISELAKTTGFTEDKIRGFCDHLLAALSSGDLDYETILGLQYKAQPTDRPVIRYNVGTKERPNYMTISKVSTGQKCTAMLILALSDGRMPILIDQPEDSLDIRGIWEDMCQKLRVGKDSRQFIFTTHNSSVAVASDTDKFTILTADGEKGEVVFSGSLDLKSVRKEVVEYLEGGDKAYILKMLKYNFDPHEKKFN